MVKCQFLYLDVKLANSEVLEDFKGWGLVLRREDPIYNFDFLKKVFQVGFYYFIFNLNFFRSGIQVKKPNGSISAWHVMFPWTPVNLCFLLAKKLKL